MKTARSVDWNVLVLIACAACSSDGGEGTVSPEGATPGAGPSVTQTSTQPASGSAGMRSAASGAAGRPAPGMSVGMTTSGATDAGSSAAANSGGMGAPSAAAGSSGSVASSAAAGVGGTSSAGSAGAGAGGASGAAGSTSAGSGAAAGSGGSEGGSSFKRPCVSSGNEVVFIGDSYSDYAVAHQPMATFVAALAAEDGALQQGDSYRNRAEAGTTLAAPPAAIQTQWETTKAMTPIRAVVMTGGGNDVLINNQQCRADGSEMRPDCQEVVQNSLDAAKNLFDSMKATGVSDVVFFWYPHIPGGLLTGYERGTTISDYTYPMLEDIAKSASTDTFHVYMVPTVQIFEGHPEYFYSDGLHANDTGTAKIAEAIWDVMTENCIAQASESGCCMP